MAISDHAMMIDTSICVNCEACTTVCKQIYGTTDDIYRTKMHLREFGTYPEVSAVFHKKACMHCTEAQCVMACPTGACHKTDDGLTVIDERTCIQCNYCAGNCPFGVITYDRTKTIMEKCTLCNTRIEKGLAPFCAEVCTPKAITYGARAKLVANGKARVKMLKEQGYDEANLYGENELGGLRVLMVLQHNPGKYGLPEDPEVKVGTQIWKYLIKPFGGVAALAAIGGLLYNYSNNKRGTNGQDDA